MSRLFHVPLLLVRLCNSYTILAGVPSPTGADHASVAFAQDVLGVTVSVGTVAILVLLGAVSVAVLHSDAVLPTKDLYLNSCVPPAVRGVVIEDVHTSDVVELGILLVTVAAPLYVGEYEPPPSLVVRTAQLSADVVRVCISYLVAPETASQERVRLDHASLVCNLKPPIVPLTVTADETATGVDEDA